MRQSPRITCYMLITIAMLLLGIMRPAEATFQMKLSSGNTTTTISDNGSNDNADEISGLIAFSGSIGNFFINVTLGSSKPLLGSPTNPMLNITSFDATSFGGGTLTIQLSDTEFGPVGPSTLFSTNLNGIIGPGSISAETYFDNGNSDFMTLTPNLVGSVAPLTGASSGSNTQVATTDAEFSMNMVVKVTHAGAGGTLFNATAKATSVPEPSATLCLGIALFGIGGYTEWRRRKIIV